MSALNIGDTIKITGANRHPRADALLDGLDLTSATIVDIGASDGSTSLDLIRHLAEFEKYVIADLYLTLTAVRVGPWTIFLQGDTAVLLVGRRLIAWPGESAVLSRLLSPILKSAAARRQAGREVLLLNPDVQALMRTDPRVTYRTHDVFTVWDGPAPDVIKVANLLRRLYFDDATITAGLVALLRSLPENGHLLIVDNPRMRNTPPRGGLYRRSADRFEQVAQTQGTPEVHDLIAQVSLG